MKKFLNSLIVVAFIGLFIVFVYKLTVMPDIFTASVDSVALKNNADSANKDSAYSEMDVASINKIVHDYIMDNPEILESAAAVLQQRKQVQDNDGSDKEFLSKNLEEVQNSGEPPYLGSNDADIIVVIFYDYNCGYCKKAEVEIQKVLEHDKAVKFILRPISILGDSSRYAAKLALAVYKIAPDKFLQFHANLIKMKIIDDESVKSLLKELQIDFAVVENEINSAAIKTALDNNFSLARNLGVKGAPSQVINGVFVHGMVQADQYDLIFKELRSNK